MSAWSISISATYRPRTDRPRNTRPAAASLAVAAFSTIVEWYDFTLYLYFATVLSRVFFGGGARVAAD